MVVSFFENLMLMRHWYGTVSVFAVRTSVASPSRLLYLWPGIIPSPSETSLLALVRFGENLLGGTFS